MKATPIKVYGIPACDTVKKARAWLLAHGIEHQFHDFKKLGVPEPSLDLWLVAVAWERLLNTRSTTWRKLGDEIKAAVVDQASARALMRDQPSVIKRPVVQWADGAITVGFEDTAWRLRMSNSLPSR